MSTIQAPAEQLVGAHYVLLDHVSWEAYEALAKSWADLPRRLTYDRGRLEIMSPLPVHERCGGLIARLIEAYTFELDIPCQLGGSMTFKQPDKERGLEPDRCYWIQNEPSVHGRDDYDPESDPPPDLAWRWTSRAALCPA